eukprot:6191732-Pleurochrysis_carterae.AAC.5
MMYKWGNAVATLPSDEGDYAALSLNGVNSANHIQTLLCQRHTLSLALCQRLALRVPNGFTSIYQTADQHVFGCMRTCLLFPWSLFGGQPVAIIDNLQRASGQLPGIGKSDGTYFMLASALFYGRSEGLEVSAWFK